MTPPCVSVPPIGDGLRPPAGCRPARRPLPDPGVRWGLGRDLEPAGGDVCPQEAAEALRRSEGQSRGEYGWAEGSTGRGCRFSQGWRPPAEVDRAGGREKEPGRREWRGGGALVVVHDPCVNPVGSRARDAFPGVSEAVWSDPPVESEPRRLDKIRDVSSRLAFWALTSP